MKKNQLIFCVLSTMCYICNIKQTNTIMSYVIEERKLGDFTLKMMYDEYPDSPREWSNLGTMVCFHNRYDLGDDHNLRSDDYDGWDDMEKNITENFDVSVILPLYLYDHSGITISTSPFGCPWDSGRIGFIYVTKEQVRNEYGVQRITKSIKEKVVNVLKGEVETYDMYIRGEVFGYRIEDKDGNIVDSCFGYYDQEDCLLNGQDLLEYYVKENVEVEN